MGNTFYFAWEPVFMEWLQGVLGTTGTSVLSFFSNFGEELIMVAIFGFLYWCYNKEMGVFVGTNLMTDLIWNPMIKNIALRRRPYMDNPGVKCLRPVEKGYDIYDVNAQGYSFPSGHSSNSVTFYASCAAFLKKKWSTILTIVLCALIGLSRVVVGVHYPTDVLCGWLLGLVILIVVSYLQRKIADKRILYAILLLIAIPGWFYCTSDDFFTGFGMMIGFFAGVMFEQKYVRFTETRIVWRAALRLVLGIGLFVALNTVFKLPFPKEMRDAQDLAAHVIRSGRYMIVVFLIIGIYPLSFRFLDGKLAKKTA